jgi:hypothetical protein
MEAVVANHHHCAIRSRQLHEAAQHGVVVAVGVDHNLLKKLGIRFRFARHFARVIAHEAVREVIDARIINGGEIPRLVFYEIRRRGVNAHGFGDDRRQIVNALISLLIDFLELRSEHSQDVAGNIDAVDPQRPQPPSP